MRILYNLLIILLLFVYCGSDTGSGQKNSTEYKESYSEDLISLDLSFGSEKYGTKEEFLVVNPLSSPFQLLVNNNEDILLVDEGRIKIYDKNGIGKKILGRPGYGPGEFEDSPNIFLGPTGYLLALTSPKSDFAFYNFYAPDYNIIDKIRIQNNQRILEYVQSKIPDIKSYRVKQMIPLNEKEKIYLIEYRNTEALKWMVSVLYENNDGLVELLNVKKPSTFTSKHDWSVTAEFIGSLLFNILSGRRLVYINTDDDKHDEQIGSSYSIHIISLDTREDKRIIRMFDAIEFTEDIFEELVESGKRYNNEERQKEFIKFLRKKKFNASIRRMKIDRQYAFVELFQDSPEKEEFILDVFDLKAGKFIKQVVFPTYLLGKTIKNGYLYSIYSEPDEFAEIRKYKLHPSVYGK